MFDKRYQGLRIEVSRSAMMELMKLGMSLYEVVALLEKGYHAPRKRKPGTIEKWLDKGNKTFNAVIVKSYNDILQEECWLLIHFGKFTRRQ